MTNEQKGLLDIKPGCANACKAQLPLLKTPEKLQVTIPESHLLAFRVAVKDVIHQPRHWQDSGKDTGTTSGATYSVSPFSARFPVDIQNWIQVRGQRRAFASIGTLWSPRMRTTANFVEQCV